MHPTVFNLHPRLFKMHPTQKADAPLIVESPDISIKLASFARKGTPPGVPFVVPVIPTENRLGDGAERLVPEGDSSPHVRRTLLRFVSALCVRT